MALLSNLLDILCPRTCPSCGGYSNGICDACMRLMPRTEQAQLRQNSTEEALALQHPNIVRALKVLHVDKAACFLFYEKNHPIQRIIHKMKYDDQPLIGYQLGKQAALEMQYAEFFEGIDVIIPIPLHPKRLRERGYNQSEYIARGISDVTGIPVDTTHVTRVKNTPKQAKKSGEERRHNVAQAFEVNHPEQLYRTHILVVDDLITTGETMCSCLRTIRRFRGAKITVFALCKAK